MTTSKPETSTLIALRKLGANKTQGYNDEDMK